VWQVGQDGRLARRATSGSGSFRLDRKPTATACLWAISEEPLYGRISSGLDAQRGKCVERFGGSDRDGGEAAAFVDQVTFIVHLARHPVLELELDVKRAGLAPVRQRGGVDVQVVTLSRGQMECGIRCNRHPRVPRLVQCMPIDRDDLGLQPFDLYLKHGIAGIQEPDQDLLAGACDDLLCIRRYFGSRRRAGDQEVLGLEDVQVGVIAAQPDRGRDR
jgi:hypothetical protein